MLLRPRRYCDTLAVIYSYYRLGWTVKRNVRPCLCKPIHGPVYSSTVFVNTEYDIYCSAQDKLHDRKESCFRARVGGIEKTSDFC